MASDGRCRVAHETVVLDSPVKVCLAGHNVMSDEVAIKLDEFGVVSTDDLRYLFMSRDEADAAGLGEQWAVISALGSGVAVNALSIIKETEPIQMMPRMVPIAFKKQKKRRVTEIATPAEDSHTRMEMARRAVKLSLSWAPNFGIAGGGVAPSEQWIQRCAATISRYEFKVVKGAIGCWEAWTCWCKSKSIPVYCSESLLWDDFIHGRSGAVTMPRTTWAQAEWLARNLKAPIPISDIKKPAKKESTRGVVEEEQQTPVADPELLIHLEVIAKQLDATNHPDLGCVLAALVIAYGGVRHVHLSRARLVSISNLVVRAVVYRGKRTVAGARPSFKVHFPVKGTTGFEYGKVLWSRWNKCCREKGSVANSIVLDFERGVNVPVGDFNATITRLCAPILGVPKGDNLKVTSYWFRSVGATLADQRRAPWHERLPLGDWLCKGEKGKDTENLMPLRYSRSKVGSEKYVKLLHIEILKHLVMVVTEPITWEKTRGPIESMNVGDLRVSVAQALDEEVIVNTAYGYNELNSDAKGVPKFKFMGKRSVLASKMLKDATLTSRGKPTAPDNEASSSCCSFNPEPDSKKFKAGEQHREKGYSWVVGSSFSSVVHFVTQEEPGMPICKHKKSGGKALKIDSCGQNILGALELGRNLCLPCLRSLPVAIVDELTSNAEGARLEMLKSIKKKRGGRSSHVRCL